MEKITGTSNQILKVDLSTRSWNPIKISDRDRRLYLGGKGLALKLLFDYLIPGMPPLEADNILVFTNGVIIGTGAPCSSRFSAAAKSPLTGTIIHSSCGGPFGLALKTSGWDGLLIQGKSSDPVFLSIHAGGVDFKDATSLWGKITQKCTEALANTGSGSLVIGPAGENRVSYANIRSGERFLGRGGLGAVMGSKNLKAIVARGKESRIIPRHVSAFKKTVGTLNRYLKRNTVTGQDYAIMGTSAYINKSSQASTLPVHNFQDGRHELHGEISGEAYRKLYYSDRKSCEICPIRCGHQGHFQTGILPVPEYETIALLGSNLGIFDKEQIASWSHLCGDLGLDTMSTGGTLAWVMEAAEKGLFNSPLRFGQKQHISRAIAEIAYQRGFHKELGLGSRCLAEKYGGRDFAIQVKGMEIAGYDPRGIQGQGLSYAVANRGGCHLSGALFALEAFFKLAKGNRVFGKPYSVTFFENLYATLNSLHICQFTAYAAVLEPPLIRFTPNLLLKFFLGFLPRLGLNLIPLGVYRDLWQAVTGHKISKGEFKRTGRRIHILHRYMNTREGVDWRDDILPARLLKEKQPSAPHKNPLQLDTLIKRYYRLRGYNQQGIPRNKTLLKLGIKPKDDNETAGL